MVEVAMTFVITTAEFVWEDNRTCLVDPEHPNPTIEKLQSYTSQKVSPDFYTYIGFRDWWRLPLVYPFSIQAIDTLETGSLVDVSDLTDFKNPNDGLQYTDVDRISGLTYDQNFLLVRTSENEYLLFDFNSATSKKYGSQAEMFEEARKLNFNGEYHFLTLEEYNLLLTCEKNEK